MNEDEVKPEPAKPELKAELVQCEKKCLLLAFHQADELRVNADRVLGEALRDVCESLKARGQPAPEDKAQVMLLKAPDGSLSNTLKWE